MCVRLFFVFHHASFWRLAICHGKTVQGNLRFVCVSESVYHWTADNTLGNFLKCKIVLKLDIDHSHYGYNIMDYHVVT